MSPLLRLGRSRLPGSARIAVPLLLVVLLSAAGYAIARHSVAVDRDAAARGRAAHEAVRLQEQLGRARAFAVGLGDALAGERVPSRRRFASLQGSATGTAGLTTALWVERVPAARRATYERRIGAPITALGRPGPVAPAPSYLPATFVTGLAVRPGFDVRGIRPLAATLEDPASLFAGTGTPPATLAGRRGLFVVQGGRFGRGPGSDGFLVVFVPADWLALALKQGPQRVAVSLDGRRLVGALRGTPVAGTSFEGLTERWRVDVARDPATALQSTLPWLALLWPPAIALLAFAVARGVLRRRRAEREVQDIFDLSLDLLCIAGVDGYFKRVNPAFERTLGYSAQELLSRPWLEFVHPDDRTKTDDAARTIEAGRGVMFFENRYVRGDGGIVWLQWNTRPLPQRGLMYGAARDVTEARTLREQQQALRRVAVMIAEGREPAEVFGAVAAEVAHVLGADATGLLRDEPDGTQTVVARHGDPGAPGNGRGALELTAPIVVDGRRWGDITGIWRHGEPARQDTERRMAEFTELAATAIANAQGRAELTASRARIVAAADETRRRIERDLHDGIQQRLVSLALGLRTVEADLPDDDEALRSRVAMLAEGLAALVEELQEISRGLHPAIVSKGGLAPALRALARRSAVPVELDLGDVGRLPEAVEIAAYYVVAEALTNAAKHAGAELARVHVEVAAGRLALTIADDGAGGADPSRGSGLIGLRDRVEALGGLLALRSERGAGTVLRVEIPVVTPAPRQRPQILR